MAEKDAKQATAKLIYPDLSEEDVRFYANFASVNNTPWDFALHFGLIIPPPSPQLNPEGHVEIPVRKIVTVNIPVPLIRGLIKALETSMEAYEKLHGEIKIPREDK